MIISDQSSGWLFFFGSVFCWWTTMRHSSFWRLAWFSRNSSVPRWIYVGPSCLFIYPRLRMSALSASMPSLTFWQSWRILRHRWAQGSGEVNGFKTDNTWNCRSYFWLLWMRILGFWGHIFVVISRRFPRLNSQVLLLFMVQLEVIQALLKACNKVEQFKQQVRLLLNLSQDLVASFFL